MRQSLQLRVAQTRQYAEKLNKPYSHKKIDTCKRRVALIRKSTVRVRKAFSCRAFSSPGVPPQSSDVAQGTPSSKLYVSASTLNDSLAWALPFLPHAYGNRALASKYVAPFAYSTMCCHACIIVMHSVRRCIHTQALCTTTLVFGVANRVLYRMALVPMRDYVFFLAQLQNICYLGVYFTFLFLRIRSVMHPWVS